MRVALLMCIFCVFVVLTVHLKRQMSLDESLTTARNDPIVLMSDPILLDEIEQRAEEADATAKAAAEATIVTDAKD